MPRQYECRVMMIVIGKAIGKPREVWRALEYKSCTCPDCNKDGHWYGFGRSWYETKEEAEKVAAKRDFYKPGKVI